MRQGISYFMLTRQWENETTIIHDTSYYSSSFSFQHVNLSGIFILALFLSVSSFREGVQKRKVFFWNETVVHMRDQCDKIMKAIQFSAKNNEYQVTFWIYHKESSLDIQIHSFGYCGLAADKPAELSSPLPRLCWPAQPTLSSLLWYVLNSVFWIWGPQHSMKVRQ